MQKIYVLVPKLHSLSFIILPIFETKFCKINESGKTKRKRQKKKYKKQFFSLHNRDIHLFS